MTNKEGEDSSPCDPCVATLLAVHLVSQVLDEAYVIANAAKDSGRPWHYVSSLTKLRSCRLNKLYNEDKILTVFNGENEYMNNLNIENLTSVITSTPQKATVNTTKLGDELSFIGQGDEEIEVLNNELRKSTSMFINHLFDMSDVEHVITCDETNVSINKIIPDHNELVITAMGKIIDSYVNIALNVVLGQGHDDDSQSNELSEVTDRSSYSLLSDAYNIANDISFNKKDGITFKETMNKELTENTNTSKQRLYNDATFYENTYLTLNRDYEQYSEEDEPVLQDSKAIPMQEVELLTTNTSTENITPRQDKTDLAASGILTSAAGSRKSNIVRRCRIQGAKLLSCLRGWWWRRKLFGKRKDLRAPGSIRGLCPLSPDARRRAASLLDQRNLRTPSPKSVIWKFNTVNEALVHSSRWKEFQFKMSLNENDEF